MTRRQIDRAVKTVVYGSEGIGKYRQLMAG